MHFRIAQQQQHSGSAASVQSGRQPRIYIYLSVCACPHFCGGCQASHVCRRDVICRVLLRTYLCPPPRSLALRVVLCAADKHKTAENVDNDEIYTHARTCPGTMVMACPICGSIGEAMLSLSLRRLGISRKFFRFRFAWSGGLGRADFNSICIVSE